MGPPTVRDKAWAAALDVAFSHSTLRPNGRMKVADVIRAADALDEENRRTVRRTLNAMTALGVLDHDADSPYWYRSDNLDDQLAELVAAIGQREQDLREIKALLG